MEKELNQRLNHNGLKEVKRFGYSFALGMAILFGISLWKHFPIPIKGVAAFLCLYHLTFGLIYPKVLIPNFRAVNFIGRIIGDVLVTIIFTIVFYLLFSPIAIILRLSGKDVIRHGSIEPKWIPYPESANDPKRIEKLY